MHRHQGHFIIGLIVRHICIGQQRHILQIVSQRYAGQFRNRNQGRIRHLAVLHLFVHIASLHIFHVGLDAVQQLLHVGQTRLPLDGIIGLVEKVEAAFLRQGHGYVVRVSGEGILRHLFHQRAERADFADGRPL